MSDIEKCLSIDSAVRERVLARCAGFCEVCGYPPSDALDIHFFAGAPGGAAACRACHERLHGDGALNLRTGERIAAVETACAAGRFLLVTAAIVEDEGGRILMARRSYSEELGLRWEFPGGKVEPGETIEACLVREMHEEFSVEIAPPVRFFMADYRYESRDIRLCSLRTSLCGGILKPSEHSDVQWVLPEDLPALSLAPADVAIAHAIASIQGGTATPIC